MDSNCLYRFIEREWDIRLSGAEKMLLRQNIQNPNESLSTARCILESFRFDSLSFRKNIYEYDLYCKDFTKEFERPRKRA